MTISASMSCVTCFFLYVVVFLMKFRSSFFEVGHTHCNQDQIFCRSLIHLVDKTFSTFHQLCFHLKNSCSLTKYTEHIQFFTYWCVYVDKYLNRPTVLSGITSHIFSESNTCIIVKFSSAARKMPMKLMGHGMTSTACEIHPSL